MSYYEIDKNYTKKEKEFAWKTAIGLQDVDNIKISKMLYDLVEKNLDIENVKTKIYDYYETKKEMGVRTEEADKVSINIAQNLLTNGFSFSVEQFLKIHENLFKGIYTHAGTTRNKNIGKKEWILNNESVKYADYREIESLLYYDFKKEKEFSYKGLNKYQIISHIARFISNIWQIHAFNEGNTRTVVVFLIKYLRYLGYCIDNTIFEKNSWYFRNTLVRANYTNLDNGIIETTEFLEKFLRNILFNENNNMSNEDLKIKTQDK